MADRVYMYTKSIHVHVHVCIYVYIHCTWLYLLCKTLAHCGIYMSCGESWLACLWCWGPRAELYLGCNVACGTENCCGSPSALPEVWICNTYIALKHVHGAVHTCTCTTCVSTARTYSIRYGTSRRPYKLHLIVVGDVVNHAAQVIRIALAVLHWPIQMGLDTLP